MTRRRGIKVNKAKTTVRILLRLLPVLLLAGAGAQAWAGSADLEGRLTYSIDRDRITVEIERIANNTSDTTTGTLYVTVYMTASSDLYSGGHRVARHRITGSSNGQLGPGQYFSDIRWTLAYQAPPAGTYYVHFFTSQHPEPNTVLDSRTFTGTINVEERGGPADIEGRIAYTISGASITVEIDRIANNTSSTTTGTLYVTVRMTNSNDVLSTGYRVARHRITGDSNGRLDPGHYFGDIRWTLDYSRPPSGRYYVHFYTSQHPEPNTVLDSRTFTNTQDIGGGGGGGGDDHGNTRATATRVALPSTTTGTIDPGNDTDYFRFEVPGRGAVEMESSGQLDTLGTLFDARGNRIVQDDDGGDGVNFRIGRTLGAGTYYFRVHSYGTATGGYTLHLRFEGGGSPDLIVAALSASAGQVAPGDRFVLSATVRNRGDARSPASTARGYRETGGRTLLASQAIPALAPSATAAIELRVQAEAVAGVSAYTVCVAAVADESNTSNNCAAAVSVRAAEPAREAQSLVGQRNLGDFDGDGRADVLLRHAESGRWHFYPMHGRSVRSGAGEANLTPNLAWAVAGIGDFNGDGRDDVLLRRSDTGRWYYYPMNGRRAMAGRGGVPLASDLAWAVAGIGDFDGDGRDDVLLRRSDTGRWYYYPMNGRRAMAGRGGVPLASDLAWAVAGVGDFDGDGRDDVLLRRSDTGRWHYYPMNGRQALAGRGSVPLTSNLAWSVVGVGDMNGDGRDDVLLRHGDTGRWYYYPMNGRRAMTGRGGAPLTTDLSWAVAGIGDMNGDGRADVLLRRDSGVWHYYPMNGRRSLSGAGRANLPPEAAWRVAAPPGGVPDMQSSRYYGAYALGNPVHQCDSAGCTLLSGTATYADTPTEADREALEDCEDSSCAVISRFFDGQCRVHAHNNNVRTKPYGEPDGYVGIHFWDVVAIEHARVRETELHARCSARYQELHFEGSEGFCWSSAFCNP